MLTQLLGADRHTQIIKRQYRLWQSALSTKVAGRAKMEELRKVTMEGVGFWIRIQSMDKYWMEGWMDGDERGKQSKCVRNMVSKATIRGMDGFY